MSRMDWREPCRELCIELTSLCHQNCLHCSSDSTRCADAAKHLDMSYVEALLVWFAGQGGELIELSGGEPLLYPGIEDVIRLASGLGLRVRLYSTGLPQGTHAPSLALVKRAGATEVVFSVHAATAAIHDALTDTRGSFENTVRAVRDAVALGYWVGVHFVPTRLNADQLVATVSLAAELGADEFAVLRFVPQGRGLRNRQALELPQEQFETVLESLANLVADERRIRVRAGCPVSFCSLYRQEIEPAPCKAGKNTALIDPSGDMYPCPAYKRIRGFEGQRPLLSVAEMWTRPSWTALRTPERLSGVCAQCTLVDTCAGRCAAQRYLAHGDESIGPDPMCPLQSSARRDGGIAVAI